MNTSPTVAGCVQAGLCCLRLFSRKRHDDPIHAIGNCSGSFRRETFVTEIGKRCPTSFLGVSASSLGSRMVAKSAPRTLFVAQPKTPQVLEIESSVVIQE